MIKLNEKYFLASVRFDRKTPEEFGLSRVIGQDYCVDKDGNKWQESIMWDNGWGQENGFYRLPALEFEELWILLTQSKIEQNQLGAAERINTKFSIEMKDKLTKLFSSIDKIDKGLATRLDLLVFNYNRSNIIGKSHDQVKADYEEWNQLSNRYKELKAKGKKRRIWPF